MIMLNLPTLLIVAILAGVGAYFTLDNALDKVMLSLTAFAAEMEREKAQQRTRDAMQRRAGRGHIPPASSTATAAKPAKSKSTRPRMPRYGGSSR